MNSSDTQKLDNNIRFFYIRKVFRRKWVSKTQNLKKMLRKSLASNDWA